MKKFNLLMAAMMLFAVSFVACNNDEVDNEGKKPATPVDVTFTISDVEATLSDVTFSVTPSDENAEYLVFVYDAASVEECETDTEIVEKLYAEVTEYATQANTTFGDYLAGKVKKGVVENAKVTNLAYATNYYVLVFAVDSANNYVATTDITKKRFKTAEPEVAACTFDITYSVYLTSVSLKVTPSDATQLWHLINVPVAEYQQYTSADGEYGWTQQQFFQNYLTTEVETLKGQGLTEEEIGIKLFHTGLRTLNDSGLQAKTKYVALAGAVSYSNGAAYLTSTTTKEVRYNSGDVAENNLSFDVDVFNIDHYSAEIKITPSDLNADYYYYISFIDSRKKNMKPIDIANAAVTEYIYYWENYTELKHLDPVKGIVDLTGENKYELNLAETEYFIVVFSFEPNPTYGTVIDEENGTYDSNPGTITSAPVYVSFKTPEHGDPTKAEFQFNGSEVGPYDFNFEIIASDPTIYYMPGVALAEGFDPQSTLNAYASFLSQQMQMCMESQSPCLTYQEALETKCSSFFRNGSGKYYIANLVPETSYIGYVLAIDVKTGTFAKCYYSDVIATTTSVGSVDPTIELLGVYSGDEENGTIFGNATQTEGRPIVAVKCNDIVGASALFMSTTTDAYNDVKDLSDQNIIASFRGYWDEVKSLAAPFYFYIAEWDVERTVLAYAQDANGAEGKVARLGVTPSGVNDIEELRAYVEEYNNSLPQSAAKSLVVAPQSEPTMECVWSEAVGAPRGAEVTYHEVEPLTVASDLVRVKVIKSFHI
ncbi:MAG: hypothetical protein J6U93_03305 [Alistipes sp.]|nr:hypothetical protein [Alistipes sp.]